MSVDDFRINAFVRQVLSQFWVDLQTLRYGAVGQVVYLQGRFEKIRPPMPGTPARRPPDWISEDLALLEAVEKEIRRDHLIHDVIFRLENFRKTDGKWVPSGA
jgi:hypothetical protein